MIVELFGLPGAGKTTLRSALVSQLNELGICAEKPPETGAEDSQLGDRGRFRVASRMKLGWVRREALSRAIRVLARSPRSREEATAAFRFLFVTLERYRRCALRPETVFVFDEGIIQRLFMLLVEERGVTPATDGLIDSLPFGDALVHLSIAPRVALDRLEGRARGLAPRFANLTSDELVTLFSTADAMMVDISEMVRRTPRAPEFLRLESGSHFGIGDGLDQLVRRIAAIASVSS